MNTDFTNRFTTARDIAAKYELNTDKLTAALDELPEFRVTAPLVGGFSTGKSSLINAVIGEKLLSTDITPETAVPTEITNGSDTAVIVSDGKETIVPLSQFDSKQLAAEYNSLVKIRTSNPFFAQIPSVKLVDMPGFDSGFEVHNRAIDEYMPRSLAYILTIAADEGTLRESIITFLNELKLYDVPVYVVITKSAKVESETLEALKSHIAETVRRFLKVDDVKIAVTNAKGKNIDTEGFKAFLLELQSRSEKLRDDYFGKKLTAACAEIEKYLNDRLNHSDMSLEDLKLQREQVQHNISELEQNVERERQRFESQIRSGIDQIKSRITSDLGSAKSSIESMLLSGGDVCDKVNTIIRNAVAAGIQGDVEPKIRRYIQHVSEMINTTVYSGMIQTSDNSQNAEQLAAAVNLIVVPVATKLASTVLTTVAGTGIAAALGLTGSILGPIGAAIGALAGSLISIFITSSSKKKQEEERRALASEKASEIISSAAADACGKVEGQVLAYIAEVDESIAAEITEKRTILEKALADTEEKLRLGAAEKERVTAELTADMETIRGIADGI